MPTQVPDVPPADGFSPGFSNLEGPVWVNGALYLSHISGGAAPPPARILRMVPGMAAQVWLATAGTNGLALDRDGSLLGAVHTTGAIMRFDLQQPAATPQVVAGMYANARFNSPNDLVVASDGNLYFTDPDWQAPSPDPQAAERVYRVDLQGNVTAFGMVDPGNGSMVPVAKPNGITLSHDEQVLYVGGTGGLYRFARAPDGSVAVGSAVSAISGGTDGLTRDCAGNLYITNGQAVVVLNRAEQVVGQWNVGRDVTNVAFGGGDRQTLFITAMGSTPAVFQVTLNVPGLPY